MKPNEKWIIYDDDDATTWPEDGTWNLFTNGKRISVERWKLDALNHFSPAGRYFELEDVIGWMPMKILYETAKELQEYLDKLDCRDKPCRFRQFEILPDNPDQKCIDCINSKWPKETEGEK